MDVLCVRQTRLADFDRKRNFVFYPRLNLGLQVNVWEAVKKILLHHAQ
jgi:hypothetical protein